MAGAGLSMRGPLRLRRNAPLGAPAQLTPEEPLTPLQFAPPGARERRGQAVERLLIGLFGLAAMLLLVGLANIIMQHARLADAAAGAASRPGASAARHSDPLAEIGVVPSAEPASAAKRPDSAVSSPGR